MDSITEITNQVQQKLKTCQPTLDQTERKPCVHGTMCMVNDDGSLCLWECSVCEELKEAKERDARKGNTKISEYYRTMSGEASVPKRFTDKTLSNYKAISSQQKQVSSFCRKYLDNFESVGKDGVSIVFCGKPGTGKTHLAYAIVNELRTSYVTAVLKTASDLTSDIKSAYKSDEADITPESITRRYASLDLLVIDEVGVQVSSEAERRIFFDVMNKRYEDMKPTMMISNLSRDELTAFVGERVMDRMKEGGGMVFAFDWESHRK